MFLLFVLLGCLSCIPLTDQAWYDGFSDSRPYTVRTTKFICVDQPYQYAKLEKCSIKLLRNGSSMVSFRATITKPLEPVYGTMKIWFKSNVNIWRPLLGIDEENEICNLFKIDELSIKNVLLLAARRVALDMIPDLRMECPVKGTYAFENFIFDESMFPPFLPAGNYRNDMKLLTAQNETVISVQFFGTVRPKGSVDLSMG